MTLFVSLRKDLDASQNFPFFLLKNNSNDIIRKKKNVFVYHIMKGIYRMEKIDKIIEQIKQNKWIHYAIIVIIGIILSLPLSQIQIRETHDGFLHLLRMIGTKNSLSIGEIPPIVAPYFCKGGGYAMNLFYNPLVTYIPLLIKLFTPSYAIALKVFASICITLSGITMYKFVHEVTKKRTIAIFSAIIYLIAPYKLGDVYKRFAIGEFASFIFMPLLFIGMYNLFNQDRKKHYYIAIGTIGLILTHTITTFYTAIFCMIYIIFNMQKLKQKEIIKKILINTAFIILITMFFTMPMLEAMKSTEYAIFDSKIMSTNGDYVYENTLNIGELFKDIGEENQTTYIIGVPIFVLMCLTIFTYKNVDKKYKDFFIISLLFSFIALYASTKYCPWLIFPDFLCKLQYPWRMLGFFNFFSAFVVGVNIYVLLKTLFTKDITRTIVITLLTIIMVLYTVPILLQYKTLDPLKDEIQETNVIENPYIHHFSINREYLPVKAILVQRTYLQEKEDRMYILEGSAQIEEENKQNLSSSAILKDVTKGTIIEFPFFYYPGYKVILEDNTKLEAIETENGFVGCKITQDMEKTKIKVEYKGTVVTYVSYIVSLVFAIIFIVYCYKENKKR